MFDKIKSDTVLSNYIKDECCENDVCVRFDSKIPEESILIIKVDDYYNDLGLKLTPPSPDCFIVVKCCNGGFALHIVELKNISSSKRFDVDNVIQKFKTCFDDFILNRFPQYFFKDYKDIKLYFVSNIDIYGRDLGLKLEVLINYKLKFNGKSYLVRPNLPSPSIKHCY